MVYKPLTNAPGGVAIVSGTQGQGQLVPKLELSLPISASAKLTAGAYSDTITLFMYTD
jgi:hypothetical protein